MTYFGLKKHRNDRKAREIKGKQTAIPKLYPPTVPR
jgi:hypothetical protein